MVELETPRVDPETPLPAPKPKERRPRAAKPKHVEEPCELPVPPETPRSHKRRVWAEYRACQATALNQRKERFRDFLDLFMH